MASVSSRSLEKQQPAELIAGDGVDGEGIGQAQRERRERVRLHAQLQTRASVEPLALRIERRVDVVVEDVVLDEVVFVVEVSAARELLLRRVDRDVALAPAVEERHVLGLARGPRVRKRIEAARAYFGEEVACLRQERPGIAAQIAQVEAERFRHILVEDLARASNEPRVHRNGRQRALADALIELERAHTNVRGRERRFDRVGAREQAHLPTLLLWRGRKGHDPFAQQHERRGALRRIGHEDVARRHANLEVHRLDGQVARGELLLGVQRQTMQAFDGREPILGQHAPGLALGGLASRAPDVEPPRGDAPARAGFDEDLGDQPVTVTG
jgi:hypothetical protein